jgi:hypothetical protein
MTEPTARTYREVVEQESGRQPELARRIEADLIDVYGFEGLADVAEPLDMAVGIATVVFEAPLAVRAPEVGVLLAEIRNTIEGPDGSWNGGDTVALLCEWLTGHGYKVDGPRPA